MCGIAGFTTGGRPTADCHRILDGMLQVLRHRGPDEGGLHVDERLALGHRRLSIVDLDGGRQPLAGCHGCQVICNGEIYNHVELREELASRGHRFGSHSDSEVIVHLYEESGASCLERLNGMFALAVWDPGRGRLLLARDRMGQKPLYYAETAAGLVFASEPKALLQHPDLSAEVNPEALGLYLSLDYVPAPHSIFRGLRKLLPGEYLSWEDGKVTRSRFWQFRFPDHPAAEDGPSLAAHLRERLQEAVRLRLLRSDVPVGIFLSGGVDSSLVAALACEVAQAPVSTFSLGFDDPAYDESPYAAEVAAALGTRHHHRSCCASDVLELIPKVAEVIDEPFADPSLFPTYLVSQFASQSVKVCLGGDGGDELFAGYQTFVADLAVPFYQALPSLCQRALTRAAGSLPVGHGYFSLDFKARRFCRGAGLDAAARFPAWVGAFRPQELARLRGERLRDIDPEAVESVTRSRLAAGQCHDDFQRMLTLYSCLYLPDDILTKTDRASMANSLELRAPMLDPEVVALALALPAAAKRQRFTTKVLLKHVAAEYLPRHIVQRPKQGFALPISKWLTTELRELLCDSLSPARIRADGFFDAAFVEQLVEEHLRGRRNHRKLLWPLLMFQIWHARWGGR